MALWWIGNLILAFVVIPVVLMLLKNLLVPVKRIGARQTRSWPEVSPSPTSWIWCRTSFTPAIRSNRSAPGWPPTAWHSTSCSNRQGEEPCLPPVSSP